MVDHNYMLATRFYSYSVLRRSLRTLVTNITGLPELWDTCEIPAPGQGQDGHDES
jgi:hypothetical protein